MQLFALYDQGPALQTRDGSLSEKVLGGKNGLYCSSLKPDFIYNDDHLIPFTGTCSPSQYIKSALLQIAEPASNTYYTESQPSARIQFRRYAALPWKEFLFKDYAPLSGVFRVGSWDGTP